MVASDPLAALKAHLLEEAELAGQFADRVWAWTVGGNDMTAAGAAGVYRQIVELVAALERGEALPSLAPVRAMLDE